MKATQLLEHDVRIVLKDKGDMPVQFLNKSSRVMWLHDLKVERSHAPHEGTKYVVTFIVGPNEPSPPPLSEALRTGE